MNNQTPCHGKWSFALLVELVPQEFLIGPRGTNSVKGHRDILVDVLGYPSTRPRPPRMAASTASFD
jgi:hypothetical protein